MNKKIYLGVFPVLLLLALGIANIYQKVGWKEPTDGVTWKKKSQGLIAVKVEVDSPGYLAGLKKGDILYSINNNLTKNKIDIAKNRWQAWAANQKVTYQINRGGELIFPSFYLSQKGTELIYYYLALLGLTTLVIGFIVFVNSKKPFSMPYIFFYFLCLTFYSFYIFSPTGEMDTLDSLFYWLDKAAFFFFPPLLLNFFLIFPQRKKPIKKRSSSVYFFYLPALLLLVLNILLHLPTFQKLGDAFIYPLFQAAEKIGLLHFALFCLATLFVIFYGSFQSSNSLIKKQLRWIAYGLSIGFLPFTAFYILPFVAGHTPSKIAELTVVLQAIVPLTFAYSLSRYKLMDFEVLLKKAFTLVSSYVVIAILYFIVSSQTKIFSENRLNALILGILAIILGATLFSPLKKLFQSLIDRAIYKRSYKYRKTLLSISQELTRERNLDKLSQALLELIGNALSLKSIALLLPADNDQKTLSIFKAKGKLLSSANKIILDHHLFQSLRKKDYLTFYSANNLSTWGIFHLMPLKVEENLIGCLGMGKKIDNTYLNSEDWELLRTISSTVALALENAYLYNQTNQRAVELERLKEYSENIIESLTVGVAVLDQEGKIIGWNRILEETFGHKKEEVINKNLIEVLGKKNFQAIFPTDTQHGFRLLSEITLEMPTGGKKIFDIAKTPLLDNKMSPYGTVIVFEDITEKISLQQQLLTSEKLASIGLLSAGVAHEINTPLTGISSYIQILEKKLSNSQHSQILEKIEAQTDRVARIIKNLLNFARNPSETSFYHVDLKESLQEIVSLIDYKLKTLNIKLEMSLSPLEPIWAQGERLQQVFINIILNAIDAMPEGGTLTIELSQENKTAIIKIKDTGRGIKDQHLPHIFDPFFTTKGLGKGTGLGLSISYAIIKEHEGQITVGSETNKGSLFTIYIPMDLDKRKKINKSVSSN